MNLIETVNLTKIYKNKHIALNGANLTIPEGSVFGLVGPNGAGKTTTIRLLLGLQTPTAGKALVFGGEMTPHTAHLRHRMGFLPTNPQFPKDMNPILYLDFVGKLFGLPAEIRKPRLAALLRAVGLLSASSQKIQEFSTGMTTRLGIAASLMNDPEFLVWDEPTSGLDPEGRRHTIELIQELGQNKTLLVSSHNLNDIKKVCDHIGVLSEGKLIFNGPIQEMKKLTRATTVEIELEGDMDALCGQLEASKVDFRWERGPMLLKLVFDNPETVATGLTPMLQMIAETGLTLVAINSEQDEMTDAFIQLLEEERSHGFSRILQVESEVDALPGDTGS
jgi:ABC-2 type transport system ATP-binding protein